MPSAHPQRPGRPWQQRLKRHLLMLIGFKLLVILTLFALFFRPGIRPHVDAEAASHRLLNTR